MVLVNFVKRSINNFGKKYPILFFFVNNSIFVVGIFLATSGTKSKELQSYTSQSDLIGILIINLTFGLNMITSILLVRALRTLLKSRVSTANLYYFFLCTVFFVTINFAIVYNFLYSLDPSSFKGINPSTELMDFYYFSVVTFATVGYGDITPLTGFSKLLCTIEIIHSLLFLIFIISQYPKLELEIKKTIKKHSKNREDGDKIA